MSRGYWLSLIAVVGWLSLDSLNTVAQSPSPQGVSTKSPTVKEQTPTEANDSQKAADEFSVPVRIIESPEAQASTQAREKNSSDHDAADLEAQRKAADAAERSAIAAEWQVWPAWVQMALAGIGAFVGICGLIALIYSLVLNRRATNAAIQGNQLTLKAIEQEQTNAQKALRAYIGVESGGITLGVNGEAAVAGILIKNFGQTPAKEMKFWIEMKFLNSNEIMELPIPLDDAQQSKSTINPGFIVFSEFGRPFAERELDSVRSGQSALFVRGRIDYLDVFDEKRFTEISLKMSGMEGPFDRNKPEALGWAFHPTTYGNESN